ncbi:MAG: L,D-transpeptidase [Solirubrobacterales bacterium]|nr:L,D-transpeptidase [Solirubrobacterales bacterium]
MTEPAPPKTRLALRPLFIGLAVLIPLIPIVVGLVLSTGSGPSRATSASAATHFDPVADAPSSPSSPSPGHPAAHHSALPPGRGALVAIVEHPTQMRSRPGGGRRLATVTRRTNFGSVQTFWVVRDSGRWLGVISTLAGNNQVGWVPASSVSLSRNTWELKATLSARELTVLENGTAIKHYPIAIGKPSAPTPTGRFAVTDRLLTGDPSGPYGCCILALSATAPHAIEDWSGGNRIAIHSTPEVDSIGHPVSHGCMRLSLADGRWLLAHIPLGTPTLVVDT